MMHNLGRRFHYDHSFFLQSVRLGRWELYQIGELCLEPTSEVPDHPQRCCEFSYIIQGDGWFEHNGIQTKVTQGDLIFSPAQGRHTIRATERQELHYAYVGFRPACGEDPALAELLAFLDQSAPCFGKGDHQLHQAFRHCIDEFYREQPTDFLMAEACLTRLILCGYRTCTAHSAPPDYTAGIQNAGQLLYRIMKYINDHADEPLTVTAVAKEVGYSSCYLSHLFKNKIGITLQAHISACRIERAKELMKLRRFTITEIAEQLGYPNLQSFSRAFKKQTGKTPTQYVDGLSKK
jgi:AraC-like DNA-binding protein/mannose-6-phosphate isomerase-like protein (cupin superfamily)